MARRHIESWRDQKTGKPLDPVRTPPSQLCAYERSTGAICGASKGLHRNIAEGGDHNWTAPGEAPLGVLG